MKFCTRCGGKLLKESDTKYQCTHCCVENFENPKAAVALIILKPDNKVLLTRRGKEPEKGKLDPIGGFLDKGETFETALYREFEEETKLKKEDIIELNYLGSAHNFYHWYGHDESVVSVYFTAKLKLGKNPTPADDVAKYEEISLANLDKTELAWSAISEMLDNLKIT